jgi:hypothetical protein
MTKTKQKKQLLMNTNECQISNTKPETLIPANISVGCLDWIRVEKDWHKTEGINARATETNSGLAERNYNIKCDTGSEPLMVVEGFWLWFCRTHRQPLCWCELAKLRAAQPSKRHYCEVCQEDVNEGTICLSCFNKRKEDICAEGMAQGRKDAFKQADLWANHLCNKEGCRAYMMEQIKEAQKQEARKE